MAIACKDFDIDRKTYDDWSEFCKTGWKKSKIYEFNMGSLEAAWLQYEIVEKGKQYEHFVFLEDSEILRPWFNWALDGIFNVITTWMKKNSDNLNAPKRQLTYDFSEGTIGALSSSKKMNIGPEHVELVIRFVNKHWRFDEVRLPVASVLRSDRPANVGTGKTKGLNYRERAKIYGGGPEDDRGPQSEDVHCYGKPGSEQFVDDTVSLVLAVEELHEICNEVRMSLRPRGGEDE